MQYVIPSPRLTLILAPMVYRSVVAAIDAGAAGVNIEDAIPASDGKLSSPELHANKIEGARCAAANADVPLVINARTDVYWLRVGDARDQLKEAIRRAVAYCAAGADCIFVPGVSNESEIATLVREIPRPVNVLAAPGVPRVSRLAELGVRRVSVGSGLARAALGRVREAAKALLADSEFADVFDEAIAYGELQRLLAGSD